MYTILLLAGDGIGPEILEQAEKVIYQFRSILTYQKALIGGSAIDQEGEPISEQTLKLAKVFNAVLLGAVGGDKWNALPLDQRPEKGLLKLRKELGLYANIRPLEIFPALMSLSPLKENRLQNVDFVIVRELTGGIYFGRPRGNKGDQTQGEGKSGNRKAWNTMIYHETEIARIAHTAFKLARKRRKKLCSIDKANVLECMRLWREIVEEIHHKFYQDVDLSHMYVDHAAMQIIHKPAEFDVLLTPNMFGDILSDEAAILTGSLGMLASASLGAPNSEKIQGIYEPIHGSAPDIAGQDKANPIGLLLSLAMLLEFSCNQIKLAQKIRQSIEKTLHQGYRTSDLYTEGYTKLSTDEMGNKIIENLA